MYRCVPVALNGDTLQVALADPLDPARADEIHFAVKRDVQIVVADPAEIDKTIDRLYGQAESENFSEILKELGQDKNSPAKSRMRTMNGSWRIWPTRCRSSSL